MASGITTTGSLADSLPTIIAEARIVREFEGTMPRLVDRYRLAEGTGLSWNEISLSKLTAVGITETTTMDNPQALVDTLFTVTPSQVGVMTIITRRTLARVSKNVVGKVGSLAQNAMQRKKDIDGLAMLDGFSVSQPGAGNTLQHGVISSFVSRISGNTTEPSRAPVYAVLHAFQVKDLQDEIESGIGTYTVPTGLSEEFYRNGFKGSVSMAEVYVDGNISIDASDDAKGGVFSRDALVLVEGMALRTYNEFDPAYGGGADKLYMYDEYAYGERQDVWGYEVYSDALAPTS